MSGKNPLGNGKEPQSYEGLNVLVPLGGWQFVRAKRDPTTNDKKYPVGTIWLNTSSQNIWMMTVGGGTWAQIQSGGANVLSVSGTANQVTVSPTTGASIVSLPSAVTAPGSVTATTTLTATLGNITATNGNLSLGTAGNKIVIATGANASVGTSAAMSGTPGAVTVATTACSATAKIFYCRATTGGTPGQVSITAQDGTGFTLTSTGNETSTFNWWIINA